VGLSLIDNFEWRSGLCPRFGRPEVDYDDPLRRRIRRGSADVLAAIIE
jgi:beta-glucosidase/6-phospho-beta-glucosidase/beta-galactosidase